MWLTIAFFTLVSTVNSQEVAKLIHEFQNGELDPITSPQAYNVETGSQFEESQENLVEKKAEDPKDLLK